MVDGWLDSKTVFEPFLNPKNGPLGPQKVKNDPKIKSKSNVRIEPDPNPQNSPFFAPNSQKNCPSGPQDVENDPKIKSKSNVRIERNKENESCSTK